MKQKPNIKNVNMWQNKMPNYKKGITLISLVITIIILLILASVAISLAIDADGLFARAKKATADWNTSVGKEETEIQGLIDQLEEYVPLEGTKEDGRTLVELYEAGELKIGDYVNYNPIAKSDTGAEAKYTYTSLGTQTGMADIFASMPSSIASGGGSSGGPNQDETENQTYKVNTNTKWRVLGIEGEGAGKHLLLISADPVAKENTSGDKYFYLYGAKGYLNCITELNNIGKIYGYGEGATGARSVNIDDINKIAGVTVTEDAISPNVNLNDKYGQPYSYEDQYTPENWKGSEEESTPEKVTGKDNTYGYMGNSAGLQTNETTNQETGARLYEMIFVDTGSGSSRQKAFWLASRGVYDYSSYVGFGPGRVDVGSAFSCVDLFYSRGHELSGGLGVRPVVSLNSSVTENTIQKIDDQPRETWEDPSASTGGAE